MPSPTAPASDIDHPSTDAADAHDDKAEQAIEQTTHQQQQIEQLFHPKEQQAHGEERSELGPRLLLTHTGRWSQAY